MNRTLKKYMIFILLLISNLIVLMINPNIGKESFVFTWKNFVNFVVILVPIFVCIGLLDVWIQRETMIKIMGTGSGIRGILIAFLLGVVTAVPLYALLPVAAIMLKKGSRIYNVLIFICSCASIRIPLLLFEASSMGWKYTMLRFLVNIVVVLVIAFSIEKILTDKDKEIIYDNADKM